MIYHYVQNDIHFICFRYDYGLWSWGRVLQFRTQVAGSPEAHPNRMRAVTSQKTEGEKEELKHELHAIRILWKQG